MAKPLTSSELSQLQQYVDASDRIGYYSALAGWGYGYPALALNVVNNDSLAGATANLFFLNQASAEGVNLTPERYAQLSVDLMLADWRARSVLAGTSPGEDLSYDVVQSFHQSVFDQFGVSADAWTPNIAFNLLTSTAAKEALWSAMLTSPALSYPSILALALTDIDNPITETYLANVTVAGILALGSPSNEFGNYSLDLPGGGKLVGDDQNDDLSVGTELNDVIIGFDGEDTIRGLDGNDYIYGGEANDRLIGGNGDDRITAGAANDVVYTGDLSETGTPPTHVDIDDDIVIAEGGDDIVYTGGGSDIISLGDGNDSVHLSDTEMTATTIVWGGDGVDSYYFDGDARVLAINVEGMSDELLKTLSTELLFSVLNTNLEEMYDCILINVEQQDKFYLDGVQIKGSSSIVERFNWNEEETQKFHYKLGPTGTYQADYIYSSVTDHFVREFRTETGDVIYLESGEFGAAFALAGTEHSFALEGFVDGMGGVTFTGNAAFAHSVTTTTRQDIVVLDVNYERQINGDLYEIPEEYQLVGDAETTVVVDDFGEVRPETYSDASTPTVDLNDFQFVVVLGTSGGDSFVGNSTAQHFDGGSGTDTVDYSGSSDSVWLSLDSTGNSGDAVGDRYTSVENVVGTEFDDYITGDRGNNILSGGEGSDGLDGSTGNDTLIGGAGDDGLTGSYGDDVILGGEGDDSADAGEGNDLIDGGEGSDSVGLWWDISEYTFIRNADGSVTMISQWEGVDTLRNVEGVFAGEYHDLDSLAPVLPPATNLNGSSDSDVINGTESNDIISGFEGNDIIAAAGGNDIVNAGGGDDEILAGGGADIFDAGEGVDVVRFAGDFSDFTLRAVDASTVLLEESGNYTIVRNAETLAFHSTDGNDHAVDVASYLSEFAPRQLDGTDGNDTLAGASGMDQIFGHRGNDIISTGAGDDEIYGGHGNDIMRPGTGEDYVDGEQGIDTVVLEGVRSNYSISYFDGTTIEISGSGVETTLVTNTEWLVFDDPDSDDDEVFDIVAFLDGETGGDGTGSELVFQERDSLSNTDDTDPNIAETGGARSSDRLGTSDLDQSSRNVIQFPTSSLEVAFTDHAIASTTDSEDGTSVTRSGGTAEIVSLNDFHQTSELDNLAADLWYEPEPIGAVI